MMGATRSQTMSRTKILEEKIAKDKTVDYDSPTNFAAPVHFFHEVTFDDKVTFEKEVIFKKKIHKGKIYKAEEVQITSRWQLLLLLLCFWKKLS